MSINRLLLARLAALLSGASAAVRQPTGRVGLDERLDPGHTMFEFTSDR